MSAFLTILTPLSYLRIKHPLKRFVDFWFPACGFVSAGIGIALWPTFNLFGSSGLTVGVNGLLQILAGFFITSLAAIATFSGATYKIDEVFEGEKATLFGDVLTRRQFLCFLFSYLALLSLALYLSGAVGIAAASTLHDSLSGLLKTLARVTFAAPYFAALAHVFGTTLIGLIFLAGRIPHVAAPPKYLPIIKAPVVKTAPNVTAANTPPTPATPDATAPRP